jgi:outer membrane protein OmpA-like peptidoglycan-associated protein
MGYVGKHGRRGAGRVQGKRAGRCVLAAMPVSLALALAGCNGQNPVLTPVGWWHDLQGGAIAADRPPPPGADLPYPHIYSIPPKPVLPSASFRTTVETQLAQERDDQERLAAHTPIVVETVPPPPPAPPPPAGMEGAPEAADTTTANATLPGAEAPPLRKPPVAKPPLQKPAPAAPGRSAPALAPDGGPAAGTPLTIAGLTGDEANVPQIPDAPPAPATFEGIPAEPAPTPPPPLPAHVPLAANGTPVYFRPGDAILDRSQTQTMKDAASHRGKESVEVEGHGDSQSDAPAAQEAALKLALQRALAVAKGLQAQHVPVTAIRISATAFGRGASVRLVP